MNKTNLYRGFTLIELLVVIAIIGILAAVVIGSLNDARSSGQNASIQQTLSSLRNQAELVYNSNSYNYSTVCSATKVADLILAANKVNGSTVPYAEATHGQTTSVPTNSLTNASLRLAACHSTSDNYVVQVPLANSANEFWCVDSTGKSKKTSAMISGATACPS